MADEIPVPDAVVENFLNRGEMMILAGPPKVGKSVIMTQLAIAVNCGGKFLGEFQAQRGTVLWYDADDGDRYRAQQRLEDLGQDPENDNISIFRSLKSISDGGVEQIESDVVAANSAGQSVALVLIDCLQSILGSSFSRNAGQNQRRQLQELRALATKYEFALVIIDPTCRKAPKGAQGFSVFDAMLGTTGIGTVVDVGVVLESTGRTGEVLARYSGRNADNPSELALKLDTAGRTGWKVMSGVDQARKGRELGRVAQAILGVLENGGTRLTPTEIVAAAERGGTRLNFSSVKGNCRRMVQRGILTEHEGGRYGMPETAVTAVTAPVSDCRAATSDGYSYSYTGLEEQPPSATVTAPATHEMVQSPSVGTAVSSMPVATVPPAAAPPVPTQKQAPAEPAAKTKPVATAPQTAQEIAPAVKAPKKALTAEEKDKRILRALDELGGSASARRVADHRKSTDLSRITAHMEDMCDRCRLVRKDTPTGTVYSKATVGQTAPDLAVDVEAPAEPAAAPEEATAPNAAANQDLAELDADYIPIAQAIGTTRDTA
jgi:hypothetical protein